MKRKFALLLALVTVLTTVFTITAIPAKAAAEPASVDPNQLEAGTSLPTKTTKNLAVDEDTDFGDFYSTYNNTSSRAVMTVEKENNENYVAMRAADNVGSDYILNTSVLTNKIPSGSTVKIKIVFRPTKDFASNASAASSKFIIRLGDTVNTLRIGSAFSTDQFDGETWLTYEKEFTLKADSKYFHFYNYAEAGHGCDIKSIELTDITDANKGPASVLPNQLEVGAALPTEATTNLVANAAADFGDFHSIYNHTPSKSVMTVAQENDENYISMRAGDTNTSYIYNTSVLSTTIPNGTTIKVKMVFRPTKDFETTTATTSKMFFIRLGSTSNTTNDLKIGNVFSAEQFDGETWLTYEKEITLQTNCTYLHFYNYAKPGHGCDIKSIEVAYVSGSNLPEIATKTYNYDIASNEDLAVTVDTKEKPVESLFVKRPDDADMRFVARNAYSMSEDFKTLTIQARWLKELDNGEHTFTVQIEETYYQFTVTVTGAVAEPEYIVGDVNGDGEVTKDDAIYVLMYTFFEDEYPAHQDFDFNKDGTVTKDDAIYVLMYTFFPDDYPIE